ncbi:TPA: hypothetical protein GRR58_07035 [Vibrio parahaemolyticus]|jgi:hypothetical protein|nr:hypothetical protein [Vibrio parahaemolyticus]HAS6508174.1 hypothetical protein [Vibrio parahaemolyticus]HAS6512851.1 hypothetical protein [Vibrio parahaemolyticus]HAS6522775.1 hypothetical protein [Vibrio parahaemolyticus]HAS6537610.1 hypothetical protein [Vibrio parahaemolyticus]
MNTKQTTKQVASLAAATLQNPSASKTAKSLAGSVLAQSSSQKQTGGDLEEKASKVLRSSKYSEGTKSLAGSVLSQSNRKR